MGFPTSMAFQSGSAAPLARSATPFSTFTSGGCSEFPSTSGISPQRPGAIRSA